VSEASIIACSSPLGSVFIGSALSSMSLSRGLVFVDRSSRIEGSAHRSLDSIPFGILLGRSATTVYLCACGFVRTCQYTQLFLTGSH
jgi:hypothetical protein